MIPDLIIPVPFYFQVFRCCPNSERGVPPCAPSEKINCSNSSLDLMPSA